MIRVIDEFVVDVLPAACGLTYDELKPHVRRTSTQWGPIDVLDLEGLRLTKQSPRGNDRVDLQRIEAALRASKDGCPSASRPCRDATSCRDAAVRRQHRIQGRAGFRPFFGRRNPVSGESEALARGIALDQAFEDRLSIYGDAATLGKMLEAADQITDFHAYASEIGIEDPNSQP
ncbi:hypothetical protein M2175_001283 [Bradyrhizobium elkanii]|uniref:hypothetical protein n=1 Tax=Bradyrhizobium TaxID=374 RepID=UPI0021676DC5|nr:MULTISPECIES: hypothetical protein [Bradyrhizobium]MCS3926252.1 hypothetical protein [Bradyrhizobium elkanii]MCS3966805.1 hypothetical protein [Bradyrhizobium japonicum]